jgi:hypothetical protein
MKFQQQPHTLLMVRPKAFRYNDQTSTSNQFQKKGGGEPALFEFDKMVDMLRSHEVSVRVIDDTPLPEKPDAIFPNNWISFHEDGKIVLYPMMAPNRRFERRADIIDQVKNDFLVGDIIDLTDHENNEAYLEGTGSIVFDHVNRIAYACRSPRTSETLLNTLCRKLQYSAVIFNAFDPSGKAIYHTNVLMTIGEQFAMVCLDAINQDEDQEKVLDSFSQTGHKIISISYEQMSAFAGNAIEVKTQTQERLVLLSETAFNSLLPGQINAVTQYADLLPLAVPTIEKIGGGSVRCMVAGIHLPLRNLQ